MHGTPGGPVRISSIGVLPLLLAVGTAAGCNKDKKLATECTDPQPTTKTLASCLILATKYAKKDNDLDIAWTGVQQYCAPDDPGPELQLQCDTACTTLLTAAEQSSGSVHGVTGKTWVRTATWRGECVDGASGAAAAGAAGPAAAPVAE